MEILFLVGMSMKIQTKSRNQQNNSFNTMSMFLTKCSDASSYDYSQKKKPGGILYNGETSNLKQKQSKKIQRRFKETKVV